MRASRILQLPLVSCLISSCQTYSLGSGEDASALDANLDAEVTEGAVQPGDPGYADSAVPDAEPAQDSAGTEAPCVDIDDGQPCGAGLLYRAGSCVVGKCGDGVHDVDSGELCDDGNTEAGDGCEATCRFSCEASEKCDDGEPCNGQELCAEHVCMEGTVIESGATCRTAATTEGVCRERQCVPLGCGNGVVDGTEDCDDGNADPLDGCKLDCTFGCESDADCDDGSVCTGTETCNVVTHQCVDGVALACTDQSPCTTNACDPVEGCVFPLIDGDGDGFAPLSLGSCGTDCLDTRADVNPGAVELCGDPLDSDCDGRVDPPQVPFWYLDCDGDGYAPLNAVAVQSCSQPAAASCGGGWTTRVPINGSRSTYDCLDANDAVKPSQTGYQAASIAGAIASLDFDYNCDASESRRYTAVSGGSCAPSKSPFVFGCVGTSYWVSEAGAPVTTAPSCGVRGFLSSCISGKGGLCLRTSNPVTQTCR